MDAVEFAKTMRKICRSHTSCVECEFVKVQGHCGITNPEADHAGMVAVAERWAKAHPEEAADATKPKQDEPCVKTIPDNLEGAIYRAIASNKTRIEKLEYDVSVVRNNLAVLDDRIYALREKVDHTPTMEPSQTPEPKRTNKDVLELMVALTDKVDRLAEKIKVAEKMIEESRFVTDATFGEVDERFAEVDAQIERVDERITLCMQMKGGTKKKNKRKRKRKYALLAVLPNVDTSACPKVLDMNYKCDKRKLCAVCKHEFWNEEVEG